MRVRCITHGKHVKGGNDAATYDGPLTPEAIETLRQLRRKEKWLDSFSGRIVCGKMQRHKQTAQALGLYGRVIPDKAVGDDKTMFGVLGGDETALEELCGFLEKRKEKGEDDILLVTSRLVPIMLQYIKRGGQAKIKVSLQAFVRTLDDMCSWEDGTSVPVLKQGGITEFEF